MRLVRVRGGRSYRSERRLSSTDLQRGTAQQDAGRGGITTSILFVQPAATHDTAHRGCYKESSASFLYRTNFELLS